MKINEPVAVDVGGGHGTLLAEIVAAYPPLAGLATVVDRIEVVNTAPPTAGVRFVAGDAFDAAMKAANSSIEVLYGEELDRLLGAPDSSQLFDLPKKASKLAERDQGAAVVDVVLSVPAYYTDAERHAVLDAAKIIGLNVLRLINDTTAAALSYGIYKTDLPADKPTNVAFVACAAQCDALPRL